GKEATVRRWLVEAAMAHGKKPDQEESKVAVGQHVSPTAKERALEERPAGRQQHDVTALPRCGLHRLSESSIHHGRQRRPSPPGMPCQNTVGHRPRAGRHDRSDEECATRPPPYHEQDYAPARIREQDVETEADLGNQAEAGEHREPAEIDRHNLRPSGVQPAKQHGETDPEEEGECPPSLLLEKYPHSQAIRSSTPPTSIR